MTRTTGIQINWARFGKPVPMRALTLSLMTDRSSRQVWSIAALAVALLLVVTVAALPNEAGAASEQPTETDSKKSRISYTLMKATCPTIEGAEYYETDTTYGCRYKDGGKNDCSKHDEMCSYTPPQDDTKPSGKPAPSTAVGTLHVAGMDEQTLAPGTDVGNPGPDAKVIEPATAVWAARGQTADVQAVAEPSRADSIKAIRERTTTRKPDGALTPDQGQTTEAAIWINPEPVGNPDFDKFKGDCEGQGGRIERTGEYQWPCYLPSGLTTTCDLSPSPDLNDCGKPPDTSRSDLGTDALTKDEVLAVSDAAPVSGTPTPGEIAIPVAELETNVEYRDGETSPPEQIVKVAAELETSVEFTGNGAPSADQTDGGPSISGRPNLVIASYSSVYDAGRGQWELSITVENTGLGDAGSFVVDVLTAGETPSPTFLSDGLAAKSSQTFNYPLAGCEFNGEIVVSDITTAYTEVDRTWATIIC